MWSKRQLTAEYRGGFRGEQKDDHRVPQSPFIEHRRARLVDAGEVPAAKKTFSPPWAESRRTSWSSEYNDRFAFGEQWFEHMRRGGTQDEAGDAGGCVERLTTDSLLLPWDPSANHAKHQKGCRAPDVLQVNFDRGRVPDEDRCPQQAQVADMVEPEPRHAPAGRALAWQDVETLQEAGAAGTSAAEAIKLAEASHLVRECLQDATNLASAGPRDLDPDGSACIKAKLASEVYSQRRGPGNPPQNSGAAPIGQAFIERGPARPVAYGKGPGMQAKPGGSQPSTGRQRASVAAKDAAKGRRSERRAQAGDEGTWSPMASSKRYGNSSARGLEALHQCGNFAHGSMKDARVRPLLPATKFCGIMLPIAEKPAPALRGRGAREGRPSSTRKPTDVRGGGGRGAKHAVEAAALSGNKAKAAGEQQHHSNQKRKALQHGRPQLAAAGKTKTQGAVAAVEPAPRPKSDEPVARGRVTAVPGLALAQPGQTQLDTAVEDVEYPPVGAEGIGGKSAAWRAAQLAAMEKPMPVHFAGAGGGRASDEVLAMTSPNLVGAHAQAQLYQVRMDKAAAQEEATRRRPLSAQPACSRDLVVGPHDRQGLRSAQGIERAGRSEAMRPAGLGTRDMPTCKSGGLRRCELSEAMLRSSVGDILAAPPSSVP